MDELHGGATEIQATTWPTIPRTATTYRIPAQTLHYAVTQGHIRHVKIGAGRNSTYLLDPASLTEWLSTHKPHRPKADRQPESVRQQG